MKDTKNDIIKGIIFSITGVLFFIAMVFTTVLISKALFFIASFCEFVAAFGFLKSGIERNRNEKNS